MSEDRFQILSDKIDALIKLSVQLRQENQLLRANEQNWAGERQQLLEKNRATRARLESLLSRLKSLENV